MDKDKWDKKLANEIRNLVVANEFLGESDEDITNKIVDLIRANLKSLVEIDEEKVKEIVDQYARENSQEFYFLDNDELAEVIARANPVRIKENWKEKSDG